MTALLFLISVCRSFFSKHADLLVPGRRLAFDGEEPGPEGQTICKGSEEDAFDESGSASPQTSLFTPKAKKIRVEADGPDGPPRRPSHPADEDDSTSEGRRRKRRASERHSGFALSKDKHQTSSEEVSKPPERSGEELEAASALLALQETFATQVEPPTMLPEPTLASAGSTGLLVSPYVLVPIRATSTGASQATASIPLALLARSVQVFLPPAPALSSAGARLTAFGLEGAGVSVRDASSHLPRDEERPSTSSVVVTAAAYPGPREHPYYRVPTVNPLYRGVRRFEPERVKSSASATLKTCVQLNKMRLLLAEEQLGPLQLDELVQITYEILSYTYHYETFSTKHLSPSIATRILGRRYLFLDSAIAALQVLEEPLSEPWWKQIVSVIPDDTLQGSSYAPARRTPAAAFYSDLIKKLHGALQILKTGIRLSEEETISLKRSLFCSRFSPSNFRESNVLRRHLSLREAKCASHYLQLVSISSETPSLCAARPVLVRDALLVLEVTLEIASCRRRSHTYTGLPFQLEHAAVPDRPVAPSHAREKRGCEDVHRFSFFSYRAQSKASFAVFASVTAILFLILVCQSVRTRRDSWILTRRLSDDADSPRSSPDSRVLCVDSGEEAPEELSPTTRQTSLSAPKAKKARAEAGGERSAPSSPADENDSTSEGEGVQPLTSEGRLRKRRASELYSGFARSKDKHQTSSEEVPESPERGEEELEAASALLSLQDSLATVFEPKTILPEPTLASAGPSVLPAPAYVVSPMLATSTGAFQMAASNLLQIVVQPVQIFLPLTTGFVPAEARGAFVGARLNGDSTRASTGSASAHAPLNEEGPSPSLAVAAAAPCSGPRAHPYYRIPRVDPFHKGMRRFNREHATSAAFAFSNTHVHLRKMRILLSEEQLSLPQLDELARLAAEVLSHIYHHERHSTRESKPSNATQALGRRYLLLDSAIAALQVLEEPLGGPWWERIVSVIPDDTVAEPAYTSGRLRRASPLLVELMKKLHRALRILKAGIRLSQEETISLKRSLFFSPSAPRNLRNPRFLTGKDLIFRTDKRMHLLRTEAGAGLCPTLNSRVPKVNKGKGSTL
ncbi:hypothetical protein Emag_006624 [Eimeria magna]